MLDNKLQRARRRVLHAREYKTITAYLRTAQTALKCVTSKEEGGATMTQEERDIKIDFIKRTFKQNVKDSELKTDEQIEKIYKEAYSYSEWGL